MKTKTNLTALLLLAGLMFLPVASSLQYKPNQIVDVKVPCSINGFPCASTALCNLSIQCPNSSYFVNNVRMSYNAGGDFNYTLTFLDSGKYLSKVSCSQTGYNATSTFDIMVTPSGTELTTGQGILYVVFTVSSIFIFLLTLYGAIKLPYRNPRDEDDYIIGMNDLKYVKIFLMAMSYMILLFIFGMLRGITYNFLYDLGIHKFFYWGYSIMLSFLWPIIVLGFLFALILFVRDRKVLSALERGLPIQ